MHTCAVPAGPNGQSGALPSAFSSWCPGIASPSPDISGGTDVGAALIAMAGAQVDAQARSAREKSRAPEVSSPAIKRVRRLMLVEYNPSIGLEATCPPRLAHKTRTAAARFRAGPAGQSGPACTGGLPFSCRASLEACPPSRARAPRGAASTGCDPSSTPLLQNRIWRHPHAGSAAPAMQAEEQLPTVLILQVARQRAWRQGPPLGMALSTT